VRCMVHDGMQAEIFNRYRRPNIYFNITSPTPGTFIIALHYKGRERLFWKWISKLTTYWRGKSAQKLHLTLADLSRSKKTITSAGLGIRSTERSKSPGSSEKVFAKR